QQAERIAGFTFGIPFAISAAAAMWEQGASLNEILAPITPEKRDHNFHDEIVKKMSERFLAHCVGADASDIKYIYALALMRRPSVPLFVAMVSKQNAEDLLLDLHQRYSFIWVDNVRLDEKIASFLREYLRADIRRTKRAVQDLNDRAIEFCEQNISAKSK